MKKNMYTVDRVAEILKLHPKTIRRYIKEGRLNARKAGGQWRITEDDIIYFLGERASYEKKTDHDSDEVISQTTATIKKNITVSSVVDIPTNKEEADRISATIQAVMNGKDPEPQKARCDILYYEKENKLRLMLWGSPNFISTLLSLLQEITH